MNAKMVLWVYAALSAGNGIYRIVSDPAGGKTGLIFGLSMAAMCAVAALLIGRPGRGVRIGGQVLAWAAIVMTGGFFVFAMIKKPDQYGMVRPLLMTLASVAAAGALVMGASAETPD